MSSRTKPSDGSEQATLGLFPISTSLAATLDSGLHAPVDLPVQVSVGALTAPNGSRATQLIPIVAADLDRALMVQDDADQFLERQKKVNHKEVERRRRMNINKGMDALAAVVPDAGDTAKSKLLQRAASYITELKQAHAVLLEKTALERLMLEQTINELTSQLDASRVELDDLRNKYDQLNDEHALYKQEVARLQGDIPEGDLGQEFADLTAHEDTYLEAVADDEDDLMQSHLKGVPEPSRKRQRGV
ncbi:hypothetical protein M427DRAFT_109597 [Gonapodya prolifera JEL478]|uniref:BHLH domain-containing protein n=1 Tax=Gonapodya prolifera (strain JEL478) TaxID=1344416 RepID=A0A139ANR8_GONPJ|nr:hypothetical protein M427DRAFT_109597 [Gonapodya prolifera JEL478]|eukprot:KXS18399.1 hypothetical protein M427DRAFT_109597 [Gonapodya prolifera JEL478]